MKKIIILYSILFISVLSAKAQQDILYSQYMFDKMLINPAYAGSSNWMVASIKNRTSMVDIEGAPMSNFLTFQMPFHARNIGVGIKVVQDKISVNNNLNASGFFSYHIGFGGGKLSFGLEAGMMSNTFDYSGLNRHDLIDNSIPTIRESSIIPDATTGIFFQGKSLYLGVSANHLFNWKSDLADYDKNNVLALSKSFYGVGGYGIEIGKNFVIEPGFLVKYMIGLPLQVDGNLSFIMLDRFAVGFSYRTGDAVIAMAKIDITRRIKIAYSFDYTISRLANYSNGCHEISLSYGIEIQPPPEKRVIHPRYYF